MNKEFRSKELFVLGVALALLVGVPIVIFSIYYFADNVTSLVMAILFALCFIVFSSFIIVIYRNKILKWLYGTTLKDLTEIADNGVDSFEKFSVGNIKEGRLEAKKTISSFAAYVSWLRFRNWVINLSIGLIVAFSTLIGTSLLHQQNKIIRKQNTFFQEQILRDRITSSSQIVFAPNKSFSPARKSAALFEMVSSFKALQPEKNVNLSGANLAGCDLSNTDVSNLIFRDVDLRGVNFKNANLENSQFNNCDFSPFETKGWSTSDRILYSDFRYANLSNVSMISSNLFVSDFSYANFSGFEISSIILASGESSGVSQKGSNTNIFPYPLLLEPKNISEETLSILTSEYGAITNTESLKNHIDNINKMKRSSDQETLLLYANMNPKLYEQRLKHYEKLKTGASQKQNNK